jgi:hypothetical protein
LALLAFAAHAKAADDPARNEARKLAYAGVAAYQASDYVSASEKLDKAFAMLPAPSVGLYSARALAKLGKLTAAAARYRQISKLVITAGERNVQEAARQDAAAELTVLTPRIPGLRIQLEGATLEQAQVTVDGSILSASELGSELLLDPGRHQLQARRGAQVVDSTVELREGAHTTVTLRLLAPEASPLPEAAPERPALLPIKTPPARPPPSTSLRTAGFAGLVAGGAALAFSGISLLIALGEKPQGCLANVCEGSVTGYNTWRTVSAVGFYTGAVLSAAGVTLLLAGPKSSSSAQSLSLTLRAGGASLHGGF